MTFSRAELFWLAYLWVCHEHCVEQAKAILRAWYKCFGDDGPDRVHEASLRASPLMKGYEPRDP